MKRGLLAEWIADGVWRLQGNPGRLNVYFLEDGDGVVQFDAGGRCMLELVRAAAAQIGPLTEVVLGHAHTDHRGTAPFLGVPVCCHGDEVEDAEGSGGWRYWGDLGSMDRPRRMLHKHLLHPRYWDGGPVAIERTLAPGDTVAGFEVVHVPGHAPGLIALVRHSDGVALTSDLFYTVDQWCNDTAPRLPDADWNDDTALARESLARFAAIDVSVAWPGHGDPVRGDVRGQLRAAAAAA